MSGGACALVAKWVLLMTLLIGLSWTHPDVKYPPQKVVDKRVKVIPRGPFGRFNNLIARQTDPTPTSSAISAATGAPLECFQVAGPVLMPQGPAFRDGVHKASPAPNVGEDGLVVVLMEHSFANSYGAPFIGNYTPPDYDFDRVVINFTVLVKGRQYDRTGVMYFGDTEVWRTSTAEPTASGIRWVWLKDMTPFVSLWKAPQTLIFDLESIVDDTYTGILNTTLTATFFKGPAISVEKRGPADLIIPISERTGSTGEPSQFTYPEQNATNIVSIPQNVNRAVFTVDVKGQGDEEFWWSNVPQSAINTFEADYGTYPGYSPFREVQVLIDGRLAGVSWPFPVIYTGGVVPQLHRPIVGIEAFDIREHEIDITPWLPLLCDGNAHTFTIQVLGLDDDGVSSAHLSTTTDSSWYITGKIFLWLDADTASITTGELGAQLTADPTIAFSQRITQNATGGNDTLDYTLAVTRTLSISSYVRTQNTEGTVTWAQSLSYSNNGGVYAGGFDNVNTFGIAGADTATGAGLGIEYSASYSYPLYCSSSAAYSDAGDLALRADLNQSLVLEVRGDSVFPAGLEAFAAGGSGFGGSVLSTSRNGTATYMRLADNSHTSGVGRTRQIFSLEGVTGAGGDGDRGTEGSGSGSGSTPLYYQDVSAFNDTVTDNHVEFLGVAVGGT
ncbi:peptide N-acetyl-beta-D-glucosaminyl asparaginase amidase A-domain-containing protein [Hypoxylon fragiforme]|uniref:peptide N-acetyl-beta-D-glucosaminyl asparaginase amidase A-domain-containing protein n=1 Tax=Hypoxylon fragiforme TaxID=63214 RepID=UPI0020C60378|nr:peptide N-acetyl-beta-D-glucosaminyl asparaginase amidase A-domain-containing protein [Hypoxylon fragiforme]KAI2610853.1 peptide N-acetyl-beta-D-glucosaminyl asparaginase amidase A-domain-containing protein [Hypoxylon fragiforme]